MTALTRRPQIFTTVVEVHADRLYADLEIEVTSAPGPVTLTATGEGADTIRAQIDGATLRITGGPARSFTAGGVTVVGSGVVIQSGSISGGNVSIGPDGIIIDGVRVPPGAYGQPERPRVHARVPEGTAVTLTSVHGNTSIGDLRGNLAVVLTGHSRVTAGQVAGMGARITGSGDVTVGSVAGPLVAEVLGSGDVHVNGGHAEHARLSVTGSGDVAFNGTAQHATLTVTGSGDVYLARSLTPPTRTKTGTGDIRIGYVGGGGRW